MHIRPALLAPPRRDSREVPLTGRRRRQPVEHRGNPRACASLRIPTVAQARLPQPASPRIELRPFPSMGAIRGGRRHPCKLHRGVSVARLEKHRECPCTVRTKSARRRSGSFRWKGRRTLGKSEVLPASRTRNGGHSTERCPRPGRKRTVIVDETSARECAAASM